MTYDNLIAPQKLYNQTLADADTTAAKLATAGWPVSIFVENRGTGGTGSFMIPEKAKQDNGNAEYVDTNTSLENFNGTGPVPRDLAIFVWFWEPRKGHYCNGAGVTKSLSHGLTAEQALS